MRDYEATEQEYKEFLQWLNENTESDPKKSYDD